MTFLKIFSRDKLKQREKATVIVDNREKNSLVVSELIKLNLNVNFEQLAVADYLVNNIAIERKTISDFKSSIINKRIIQQLQEIKQFDQYFLLVEGIAEEDIYSGTIHENALRGFLLSTVLDYKVPIIFTKDFKDTAKYIDVLARRSVKESMSMRANKIIRNEKEQLQYIVEGIPGIGPVNSKKLLLRYKTLKHLVNAPAKELEDLIGKKSSILIKLFNYSYSS